ncbi:hypothetical protein [Enterococcus wangshanyuanii]|uniref:Uncharacterized protein n=1 Tax=Enterococcus wangshanyuanii TaxID=2005703 RepID=A0ABQ1PRG8_9ENTE|nr:hypothetical protein [Enterococcus wangshanyuanii]GGD02159.1 hypothetical protein GCM10011573_34580 [Enterococcus wangshanyuanii]
MEKIPPQLPKTYFVRSGYFKGWLKIDPNWTKKEFKAVKEYLSSKEEKIKK